MRGEPASMHPGPRRPWRPWRPRHSVFAGGVAAGRRTGIRGDEEVEEQQRAREDSGKVTQIMYGKHKCHTRGDAMGMHPRNVKDHELRI